MKKKVVWNDEHYPPTSGGVTPRDRPTESAFFASLPLGSVAGIIESPTASLTEAGHQNFGKGWVFLEMISFSQCEGENPEYKNLGKSL